MVSFAFKDGNPSDIFVQKAPNATIAVLAQILKELFDIDNEVVFIDDRHTEKMYETLYFEEEMAKS